MMRNFMKKFLFCCILIAASLITLHSQEQNPVVTIINDTGYTVRYLFISPVEDETWEEDFLGREVLPDGESFEVALQPPLSVTNRYDILLIDEEGDSYSKWNVLITQNSVIEFTLNDLDY